MKILLDICCGPCSTHVINELRGHDLGYIFPNSNIFPEAEYKKRLSEIDNLDMIVPEYNHGSWLAYIKGMESEKEGAKRCERCFEYRLETTARYAKENGFEGFTTTLTVSPHKDAAKINRIGKKIADRYGIVFLECDFKKKGGYKKSIDLSTGMYRQKYCGCEFSIR